MAILAGGAAPSRPNDNSRMTDLWQVNHPGFIALQYYLPTTISRVVPGAIASTAGRWLFYPVYLRRPTYVTGMGIRTTAGATGGTVTFAIYANDATRNKPNGAALQTFAALSTATAGGIVTPTTAKAGDAGIPLLPAGWYWFACCFNDANAIPICVDAQTTNYAIIGGSQAAASLLAANAVLACGCYFSGAAGTVPVLTSSSSLFDLQSQSMPAMIFRAGQTG
jgi:hypothetical protein